VCRPRPAAAVECARENRPMDTLRRGACPWLPVVLADARRSRAMGRSSLNRSCLAIPAARSPVLRKHVADLFLKQMGERIRGSSRKARSH